MSVKEFLSICLAFFCIPFFLKMYTILFRQSAAEHSQGAVNVAFDASRFHYENPACLVSTSLDVLPIGPP